MPDKKIINVPNSVTAGRLILIYFFLNTILRGDKESGIIIYGIIALSDIADGFLARKLNQETLFGKLFDAITDTIFLFSAYIAFMLLGKMSLLYLILLMLPRLITFVKESIKSKRNKEILYKASIYRKFAGAISFLFVLIALLKHNVEIEVLIVILGNFLAIAIEFFSENY